MGTPHPVSIDTDRDVRAAIPPSFRLASGEALTARDVVGRLHGREGPLVVVAGGISSGRFARDWWPQTVGEGRAIAPGRFRVLAFDFLPGRENPRVTVTTEDQARLLALLLDVLGEPVVDAFVGASYGGCVGLAFAQSFPQRLRNLVVISAAHRAHPAATAWRGVQRRILTLARDAGREADGIALARELAMTTYRTAEEFDLRFAGPAPRHAGDPYPVCDYLTARGRAYGGITGVDRWISLSDSLDRHRVEPQAVACPTTVVAFTSDRLVPPDDSRALADRLPNLRAFVQAPSIFGHDAFLKEAAVIDRVLRDALTALPSPSNQEIAA